MDFQNEHTLSNIKSSLFAFGSAVQAIVFALCTMIIHNKGNAFQCARSNQIPNNYVERDKFNAHFILSIFFLLLLIKSSLGRTKRMKRTDNLITFRNMRYEYKKLSCLPQHTMNSFKQHKKKLFFHVLTNYFFSLSLFLSRGQHNVETVWIK